MTLEEMIRDARRRADDLVANYLWSNAEWIEYANDAEIEACRRARLITDSTTTAICAVTVTAADGFYDLDERVQFIRRAIGSWSTVPLKPASVMDLDANRPGWESETGDPQFYIQDMDTAKLRLFPTPATDGTVRLTVKRDPLVAMEDLEDTPEIASRYHRSLIYWMLFRAYSKEDTQTYRPKEAERNLALFEAEFGQRSSAKDEAWIREQHGFTQDEGVF